MVGLFYCTLILPRFADAITPKDYKDMHARDPEDRPANVTVGLVPAILSNRISHFLNLKVGLSPFSKPRSTKFDAWKGTEHDH